MFAKLGYLGATLAQLAQIEIKKQLFPKRRTNCVQRDENLNVTPFIEEPWLALKLVASQVSQVG